MRTCHQLTEYQRYQMYALKKAGHNQQRGCSRPHKRHTQTITADNGKEFAHHATISQALDAAVYFTHPYQA